MFIASEQGVISSSFVFSSTTNPKIDSDQGITFNDIDTYAGIILFVIDALGNIGSLTIPEF